MAYPGDFDRWFDEALAAPGDVAFAVVAGGREAGSTRYLNFEPYHRRVEIGWTWLRPSAWGTGANVETKLLLCERAFEVCGLQRVEFKTDRRNERTRGALLALGAQFEGIARKHMMLPNGPARLGVVRPHRRRLARGEGAPALEARAEGVRCRVEFAPVRDASAARCAAGDPGAPRRAARGRGAPRGLGEDRDGVRLSRLDPGGGDRARAQEAFRRLRHRGPLEIARELRSGPRTSGAA